MEDQFILNPEDQHKAVARQSKASETEGLPEFDPYLFDQPAKDLPQEDVEAVQKARDLDDDKQLSVFLDIPLQAVGGLRDAANAIKDLPIDIGTFAAQAVSDEQGDAMHEANAQKLKDMTDLPEVPESDNPALGIGRKIVQFAAPFSAVSKLNKAANATRLQQAATTMFNGALTDLAAWDADEDRLADMLEKDFGLSSWLAGDEDDSAMERRVKTVLEGAGLGLAFDGVVKGVRFTREVIRGKTFAAEAAERAMKSREVIKTAKAAVESVQAPEKFKFEVPDFRPDKETISIETQRRLAEAVGTTVDDVKTGKAFKGKKFDKVRNTLNSYTLVEEQALDGLQNAAAEHYFRATQGDKAARGDFVEDLFDALSVHGKVQDATQDIARAQGFRSHVGAVSDLNLLRDKISKAKPHEVDEIMKAIGEFKTKDELRAFLKNVRNTPDDVLAQSGLREITERWFMNSILSSPVTLLSDTISNVTFTAYNKLIEKPAAAAIGGLRSLRGGNVTDRVRFRESAIFLQNMIDDSVDAVRLIGRGYKKGGFKGVGSELGEAIEKSRVENFSRFGKRTRKEFLTPERLQKVPAHLQGPAQFAYNLSNFPTHFMQSKDDVVKGMLYRSAVRERAYRSALNEGLQPGTKEFTARVNFLKTSPIENIAENMDKLAGAAQRQYDEAVKAFGVDDVNKALDIQRKSVSESRKLTFTDQPSKISQGVNMVADNLPGGRFVVPFVTTIDNLTRRAGARSILPLLDPQTRALIASGTAEGDEALARIITGTTFQLGGYMLANQGAITGDGPINPDDRNAALEVGYRPRSFLINGKYIDFSRQLGPLALMFQVPANISELARHRDGDMSGDLDRDVTQYILLGAKGFGKTVLSQSWARGISDLFDSLNAQDESGVKRQLENIASSLVIPNAATFVANELNPTLQEAASLWERIQVKAGMNVRPKRNVFGEVISRDEYLSVMSPAITKDLREIPEWKVKLYNAGAFPNKPSRRLSLPAVSGIEMTADQYERYLELVGERPYANGKTFKEFIVEFVDSPAWESLPEVKKVDGSGFSRAEFVKQVYSHVLNQAEIELIQELPEIRERAIRKALLERTTPALSPLAVTHTEVLNKVRNQSGQ